MALRLQYNREGKKEIFIQLKKADLFCTQLRKIHRF